MKFRVGVWFVITACGSTTPAWSPTPVLPPVFDQQIVLGQRVGPVSLGMTEQQLAAVDATAKKQPYGGERYGFLFDKLHISAVVDGGVVVQVAPTDGTYATSSGMRVWAPLPANAMASAESKVQHGITSYCLPDHTMVTVTTDKAMPACPLGNVCDIVVGGCKP
ncbi:MAG: hypothetical protein QM831_30845 [Kofleriaceae bacterium]